MAGNKSKYSLRPLALMILKSLTPEEFAVEFFDERIEQLPEIIDSEAIVFSAGTFSAKRAYSLAGKYKKQNPGVTIIMGGFHPTACPEEAAQYADCVIAGDAEPVWEQVMRDLLAGRLQKKYISDNSWLLPFRRMDKSVFAGKKYAELGVVQWKRGCAYSCNFCSIRAFYGSSVAERAVDDVILEIQNLKEKIVFIADDNLLHNREKLKEFLIKLAPLQRKWVCQISINVATDGEILDLMAKSGCMAVIIGFESLNLRNLMEIGKKQNIANNNYDEAVAEIYSRGIMIYATFIFGYPHDTLDSFDEVYNFAAKHRFFVANFNPLMAMPGTALYDELKEQGRLISEKWWLDGDYRYGAAMHRPEKISAEQLAENCRRLRSKFYSVPSIAARLLHRVNIKYAAEFLLMNFISAAEIKQKQKAKPEGEI
ncbi:MAG: B12-binding domain-containing radical SAM protein [Gracilibacteraceae bacterium]|jgi:radical SAM superfamily enzyme YgiQ (UPF0313 family)|nr:B12-binding domain-containing radical SAM protein [Gracilibacteraceae bacterium]